MSEVIKRLSEPIPDHMVETRPQGAQDIPFLSWKTVADLLDERAPGWSVQVKAIGHEIDKIYVIVGLTIDGVTMENIGFEDDDKAGYGDPFSNSYSSAFRRAAAMFGLGRRLPKASRHRERNKQPQKPKFIPATDEQLGRIWSLSGDLGLTRDDLEAKLKESKLDINRLSEGSADKVIASMERKRAERNEQQV